MNKVAPGSRVATIDMCRGLLFVMMANTHALDLANVAKDHWLRSDIWLPNGWATVVFVVLSGYGVGYLFSDRTPISSRNLAIWKRGWQILLVMFASNIIFAALREVVGGEVSIVLSPFWYLGFLTLDSHWTISGVLFPTALVLLVSPVVIDWVKRYPGIAIALIVIFKAVLAIYVLEIRNWPGDVPLSIRLLLTEGFGGFPTIPFVLNGCMGIWLGVVHRRSASTFNFALCVLMVLQALVYMSTFLPPDRILSVFRSTVGAVGKFGWMFMIARLLVNIPVSRFGAGIEQIGRFALGSFVMHRVFLQGLMILGGTVGLSRVLSPGLFYLFLLGGTLLLTWILCEMRERSRWLDSSFRRLAL
jgi:hypothetical protein